MTSPRLIIISDQIQEEVGILQILIQLRHTAKGTAFKDERNCGLLCKQSFTSTVKTVGQVFNFAVKMLMALVGIHSTWFYLLAPDPC